MEEPTNPHPPLATATASKPKATTTSTHKLINWNPLQKPNHKPTTSINHHPHITTINPTQSQLRRTNHNPIKPKKNPQLCKPNPAKPTAPLDPTQPPTHKCQRWRPKPTNNMTTAHKWNPPRRQPPQTKPTNSKRGRTKREREREREQYFNEKKRCPWNK